MAWRFGFRLDRFCVSAKSVVTDECVVRVGCLCMCMKKSCGGVRLASRMPGRNSVIVNNNSLEIKRKLLSVLWTGPYVSPF